MKDNQFFKKVYQVVLQIPIGKVTTYGAIAKFLGSPQSSRMVGWALNKLNCIDIPAHRVVNRQGLLTGKYHFGSTSLMQQLLENEGLLIKDNQVQFLKNVFWDPNKELN